MCTCIIENDPHSGGLKSHVQEKWSLIEFIELFRSAKCFVDVYLLGILCVETVKYINMYKFLV